MRTALAALALAWSLSGATAAQNGPPPGAPLFTIKPVAPGVYAAIGLGSDAGFIVGDDGVAVVDTLFSVEAAQQFLGEIRKITDKPIRWAIDTHYHVDHTSGNGVFKAAGATVIAHPNVAKWIHGENIHLFGDRITPPQRAMVEALVGPDRTTDAPMTLRLGRRVVEIRPVEGHTGGDLAVYVPDAKVLFTGDMVWRQRAPNIIDGRVDRWAATVAGFERSGAETFVPGHGDVATRKDVADFHAYLTDLAAFTAQGRRDGLAGEALADAVVGKLKGRYDWPFLDTAARREVAYMDAELAGTKRVPQP